MRKLSNVFFKVSIIISVISIVLLAICALACLSCLPSAAFIYEAAVEGGSGFSEAELPAFVYTVFFASSAFTLISLIPPYAVSIALAKNARNNGNKGIYIANIVLGAICDNGFSVAAGIIGLCAINNEQREAAVL